MSQQEINRKEADVRDDPKLLSPPVVIEPLYQCATAVVVVGGVADAKIEVEVNGAPAGSGVVEAVLPYGDRPCDARHRPGWARTCPRARQERGRVPANAAHRATETTDPWGRRQAGAGAIQVARAAL